MASILAQCKTNKEIINNGILFLAVQIHDLPHCFIFPFECLPSSSQGCHRGKLRMQESTGIWKAQISPHIYKCEASPISCSLLSPNPHNILKSSS